MKPPDAISSPDSRRTTNSASMLNGRAPRLTGPYLVRGPAAVWEAVESTGSNVELVITGGAAGAHPEFVAEARAARIRWNSATAEVLSELATTVNSQGVVA